MLSYKHRGATFGLEIQVSTIRTSAAILWQGEATNGLSLTEYNRRYTHTITQGNLAFRQGLSNAINSLARTSPRIPQNCTTMRQKRLEILKP